MAVTQGRSWYSKTLDLELSWSEAVVCPEARGARGHVHRFASVPPASSSPQLGRRCCSTRLLSRVGAHVLDPFAGAFRDDARAGNRIGLRREPAVEVGRLQLPAHRCEDGGRANGRRCAGPVSCARCTRGWTHSRSGAAPASMYLRAWVCARQRRLPSCLRSRGSWIDQYEHRDLLRVVAFTRRFARRRPRNPLRFLEAPREAADRRVLVPQAQGARAGLSSQPLRSYAATRSTRCGGSELFDEVARPRMRVAAVPA